MVKITGRNYLLSGFYKSITISESKEGNFNVRIEPDDKIKINELDNAYNHLNLNGLSDIDKIKTIIDTYLFNNRINGINQKKISKGSKGFFSVNSTLLTPDYMIKDIGRPVYFSVFNDELKESIRNISKKYYEERIRSVDDYLNCNVININTSIFSECNYKEGNIANIVLKADKFDDTKIEETDEIYFKELIKQFIKENGYHIISNGDFVAGRFCYDIYSNNHKKIIKSFSPAFYQIYLECIEELEELKKENVNQLKLKLD